MTATSEELRFWVDMALECVRRDHTSSISAGDQRGPFLTARALGMALTAIHDAYVLAKVPPAPASVIVVGPPVPATLAGLNGKPLLVAAAAAGCQLLLLRYPRQTGLLNAAWTEWLQLFDLGAQGSAAEAAGRTYGLGVHGLGLLDAYHARRGAYAPSNPPEAYEHVVPPNEPGQGYAGGAWGSGATPLVVPRPNFPPPPGRVSPTHVDDTQHFRDDFKKVADLGFDDRSRGRTAEQELIGIYWGYDGPPELGTPPRLYMQVVLGVLDDIEARGVSALSVEEELAVAAGAAVAMADAGVHAWFYKYSAAHMMWRPIVGIRKAQQGNGTAEPGWFPLGRPDTNQPGTNPAQVRLPGTGLTPDFPAYPSGHATFGAAAFHVLRLFLVEKTGANFNANGGDSIDFDFVSDEYDGRNLDPRPNGAGGKDPRPHVTRRYASLWEAIVDNSISRVYLGVHWEFDGITTRNAANTGDEFGVPGSPAKLGQTGGVWLGGQIANAVAARIGISAATIAAGKM